MLGSKLDIMNNGWRDLVFANRNQAYGAYELRRQNAMNTNMALFIATGTFVLALAAPTIYNKIRGIVPPKDPVVDIVRIFKTENIKVEQPKIITEPQHKATSVPPQDVIQSLPPVVVNAATITDPPTDDQLRNANPGPVTMKGAEGGSLITDKAPGISNTEGGDKGEVAPGENTIFTTSEIEPAFPGGLNAFTKFLQNRIKYPPQARDLGFTGKAYISFVVERDGSLTDIKIARDPGHGLGEEAIRVLKMSPHWVPGMQNGRTVRVSYTIPINFSLGED